MLLAAQFSPSPTILPPFSPIDAVALTSPLLEASEHEPDQGLPYVDEKGPSGETSRAPLTNADTFLLHSKPGSNFTIYLDFDGGITEGTGWNNSTGIPTLIDIAYNRDSDSTTFNNSELNQIREIWKLVAEDFAPFDVNVTTEDPGVDALSKSGGGDTTWGVRSLHTSNTNRVCGGCGGVAYISSFNSSIDLPMYAFNKGISAGGNTASHEAGHALRLGHDGLTSGTTYYGGHGSGNTTWGPIMGGAGSRKLKTWSNGDYYNANNQQDDLDRISTLNGFRYRADDHGNTFAVATPLDINASTGLSGYGIIEQDVDVDLFSFETIDGNVSFNIDPFVKHPNLDIWAGIYDSAGVLVAESNPSNNVSASFTGVALSAGKYFLRVEGVGTHGDYNQTLDKVFDPGETNYDGSETTVPWAVASPVGYSDYASVGQYWITGTRTAATTDLIQIQSSDSVKAEGDSGSTPFTFQVSRTGNSGPELQVAYQVVTSAPQADNNNFPHTVDDSDFVGGAMQSGIVTIPAGDASTTLTINISGDTQFERDEHFRVTISEPTTGWTISQSTAAATILSDESSVGIASLNTAMVTLEEGDPDTGGAVYGYTLVRHGDTTGTTTADWEVQYTGFSNPASDADFAGGVQPKGQVTFNPGVSEIDISITVNGDLDVELDESFSVVVTNVSGANTTLVDPATPSRRGIITEDESPVTVIDEVQFRWRQIRNGNNNADAWGIDNVALSGSIIDDFEPDIDNSQWASIENGTLNTSSSIFPGTGGQELLMRGTGQRIATTNGLAPAAGATLSFDLIIGNGTGSSGNGADNAEGGKDVWLEYSVDGQHWDVLEKMDTNDFEQWKTVNVSLPGRTAVTPSVTSEGNSGTTSMTFNIVRSGNRDKTAAATWQIAPSGSSPINLDDVSGSTYPSGTVNFGVNDGIETVTVLITGDQDIEPDETFDITVTSTSGGPITGGPRTATIVNDDVPAPPTVESVVINDGSVQRSSVTEIHVTFDSLVDAPDSAFTLTQLGTPNVPINDLVVTPADVGSKTVVSISLSSGLSLSDGDYQLDINGSQVTARGGTPSMTGNYVFGDEMVDAFFRKYGDINGNRMVDLLDFADFRRAFGKTDTDTDTGYVWGFDSDGDDSIGLLDFTAFRRNFGT